MGTRINVLMDHDITDYRNQSAVLARLAPTVPAVLAVRACWNTNDSFPKRAVQNEWTADVVMPYKDL